MTTKADKRAAMKRTAYTLAQIDRALAVARVFTQMPPGLPGFVREVLVRQADYTEQSRADAIRSTPAHLFRTDRPELDPRRVARDRRKQGGVMVSINVDRGQIGEYRIARQIIEVINQEAKKP